MGDSQRPNRERDQAGQGRQRPHLSPGQGARFLRPSVPSGWLVLVAANLVLGGHFDIAVRDVVLAVSAYALARFEHARAPVTASAGSAAP